MHARESLTRARGNGRSGAAAGYSTRDPTLESTSLVTLRFPRVKSTVSHKIRHRARSRLFFRVGVEGRNERCINLNIINFAKIYVRKNIYILREISTFYHGCYILEKLQKNVFLNLYDKDCHSMKKYSHEKNSRNETTCNVYEFLITISWSING